MEFDIAAADPFPRMRVSTPAGSQTVRTLDRMTRSAVAVAVVCALAALAPAANASVPAQSASVALSSNLAGAHPVTLTVQLHYEMQCGSPGLGPVTLGLPAKMSVPAKIVRSSVLVDGKTAPSLTRSGSRLVVGLPVPQGVVMCDSIALGTLTIVVTRAAGIGNPSGAGAYALAIEKGALRFGAKLRIR
jgi:hypothetical protein